MNHLPLEKSIILDEELKEAGVEMDTEQVWELIEKTYNRTDYEQIPSFPQGILAIEKKLVMQAEESEFYEWWAKRPYKWTNSETIYPAATLSEMEALLPDVIVIGESEYELQKFRSNGMSVVVYIDLDKDESIVYECGETLLEAVYEALLWCLREGYLSGKE